MPITHYIKNLVFKHLDTPIIGLLLKTLLKIYRTSKSFITLKPKFFCKANMSPAHFSTLLNSISNLNHGLHANNVILESVPGTLRNIEQRISLLESSSNNLGASVVTDNSCLAAQLEIIVLSKPLNSYATATLKYKVLPYIYSLLDDTGKIKASIMNNETGFFSFFGQQYNSELSNTGTTYNLLGRDDFEKLFKEVGFSKIVFEDENAKIIHLTAYK